MPLRIAAQCANAAKLADHLAARPGVTRLIYCGRGDHPQSDIVAKQMTGGGQMIAFEVEGGKEGAFRFQNALRLIKISNNLGDAKSLITHPATTTHHRIGPVARAELGIGDGMLRLSVGLENASDLIADVERGLKAVQGG
jgi:O-succinylhomoserine sulfhydrylase